MAPPSPREHQAAPATSATKSDEEMVLPGFPDADSFVKVSSRAPEHPSSPLCWPETGLGLRSRPRGLPAPATAASRRAAGIAGAKRERRAPRFRCERVPLCV